MPQRWSSYDAEYSAASNLTERITLLYYFTSYSIPVLYTAITPYSNLFPRRKQQSFDCLSTCNVSLPAFSASCFQMTHQTVQMWLLSLTFNDFQLLSDEGPIFSLTFSPSGYFPQRLFYSSTAVLQLNRIIQCLLNTLCALHLLGHIISFTCNALCEIFIEN